MTTRRNFIKNASSFLTVPMLLNGLPISASDGHLLMNAIDGDNDKVLVLIQLNGGNDGLNTIIPIDKYNILGNVRSNILIPQNQVLSLTDETGLHPSMLGAKSLYDNAKMAVLQDVGYPNQNRSHFRSTDIWQSASPADENWITGWLGRFLEGCHPSYPDQFPNAEYPDPFALSIGSIVSETCQGTLTNFSLALTDPLAITPLSNNAQAEVPDTPYGRELDFLRTSISQANAYGEVISVAAAKGSSDNQVVYPETDLGNQLRAMSLLISGGLKTKIYVANLGGFDTHANQTVDGESTIGEHAELLQALSEAVQAFQTDLQNQGLEERVLTMTFSEFGRRIRSNDSNGTDHGTAAPMMFFGSCVNAGIIGDSPLIPDDPGGGDGVPMQFDFRSVYSSILTDWFGIASDTVSSIMGESFPNIPIVKSCSEVSTATSDIEATAVSIKAYPNPFDNWLQIEMTIKGGKTRLSLFDAIGHEVDLITSRSMSEGDHAIRYDGSHLIPGNYFLKVSSEWGTKTIGVVKV